MQDSNVYLTDVELLQDKLVGKVLEGIPESDLEEEIHITIHDDYIPQYDSLLMVVPYEAMGKVEAIEHNAGKTAVMGIGAIALLGITAALIIGFYASSFVIFGS